MLFLVGMIIAIGDAQSCWMLLSWFLFLLPIGPAIIIINLVSPFFVISAFTVIYSLWSTLESKIVGLRRALANVRRAQGLGRKTRSLQLLDRALVEYRQELYRAIRNLLKCNENSFITKMFFFAFVFELPGNVTSLDSVLMMAGRQHLATSFSLLTFALGQIVITYSICLFIARFSQGIHSTSKLFVPLQMQLSKMAGHRLSLWIRRTSLKWHAQAMFEVVACKKKVTIKLGNMMVIEKRKLIKVGHCSLELRKLTCLLSDAQFIFVYFAYLLVGAKMMRNKELDF